MGSTGLTPWEIIAPLFGAGGVTTIIVAVFSYLRAAREGGRGQPEKNHGAVGISALLADADSINKLSISLGQVALAADKIALITIEGREDMKHIARDFIDELVKIRRALEEEAHRRG